MATVAVYGAAGGVGAATSASLVTRQVTDRLLLVDRDADLLAVQAMDLSLLASSTGATRVEVCDPARVAEADVIVMAAAVPHRDGAPRAEFARPNLEILKTILAALPSGWGGGLVVASNPVDVLATAVHRAGVSVLGYVRNDSLRLREAVASIVSCSPHEVEAWSIGEHGPATVPLFDRVTVAGAPAGLTVAQRRLAKARALGWYDEWQAYRTGRTSMWTTGHGLAGLVEAYLGEEPALDCVSVPVDGRYGIAEPVCLGLPARVGRRAVDVLEWRLTTEQHDGLRHAARVVAAAYDDACANMSAH